MERYLHLPDFGQRKQITKLRCSDHQLEIEKGRHKRPEKTLRELRVCRLCDINSIETEEHFLLQCPAYDHIRTKYDINVHVKEGLFNSLEPYTLARYINKAFKLRNKTFDTQR